LDAGCEVVALCDIAEENAASLRDEFGLTARIYTDSAAMLAQEKLDCISICLWPHLHAPVTIAAAQSGSVRAIHCEKPVAPTWSEAKKMVEVCAAAGVQLTFNHQRRFNVPFQTAKAMVEAGEIGELQSMEAYCFDLFDWGTHWFDMMCFFNNETPVDWVVGQVDISKPYVIFGLPLERFGTSHFAFKNGVRGTLVASRDNDVWNGLRVRLNGSKGSLEVGEAKQSDNHELRILNSADGWKPIAVEGGISGEDAYQKVMVEIIDALQNGKKSLLDARNALAATELVFATYESARRRERISLPLEGVEGHPLVELLREKDAIPEGTMVS
ncbi:MAG TPA: Gfo/Idh/MocA family oxidoreductase, partial [Abditibacteriaceae bacterium]